ncbi:hypothetical protein WCLP8_1070014 [uncultured Gammaproteobacteria bacterium]
MPTTADGATSPPTPTEGTATAKWARSSAVEHYVDIVGVTGSIPVAPTIVKASNLKGLAGLRHLWVRAHKIFGDARGTLAGRTGVEDIHPAPVPAPLPYSHSPIPIRSCPAACW